MQEEIRRYKEVLYKKTPKPKQDEFPSTNLGQTIQSQDDTIEDIFRICYKINNIFLYKMDFDLFTKNLFEKKPEAIKQLRYMRQRLRDLTVFGKASSGVKNTELEYVVKNLGKITDNILTPEEVFSEMDKKYILNALKDYFFWIKVEIRNNLLYKWYSKGITKIMEYNSQMDGVVSKKKFHNYRKAVRATSTVARYMYIITGQRDWFVMYHRLIIFSNKIGKIHDFAIQNNLSEIDLGAYEIKFDYVNRILQFEID